LFTSCFLTFLLGKSSYAKKRKCAVLYDRVADQTELFSLSSTRCFFRSETETWSS